MKLLKEIRDEKFPDNKHQTKTRYASRIIAFDENGLIPLLFVSSKSYNKLPGGGINNKEDRITALRREVSEETGCAIKIQGEIGKIIEYRSAINFYRKWNLKQISYCYWGKIISKKNSPHFTKEEINDGFKLIWASLDEAIKKIEKDKPKDFEGSFIQKRDLIFLKNFKQKHEKNNSTKKI